MTYQVGHKYIIAGTEMFFYYMSGNVPVFEYMINGKQFLYRDETKK